MWHYIYIDDRKKAQLAAEPMMNATRAFIDGDLVANKDAALFSRYDQVTGGVHYYFSPQAASVARGFDAVPCDKPSREELGKILSGDDVAIINRL